jgi:two-component system, OmpR family, response regulator
MSTDDQHPRVRVLVVDDSEDVRAFLRAAHEDEDYAVDVAGDGDEAMTVAARFRPAVILLDLMMPNVSGWEFLTRYRETAGPHAPVIVVSALPRRVLNEHKLAVEEIMPKPISIDRLLAAIESHVRRTRESAAIDQN